jgi:hypothetical protein
MVGFSARVGVATWLSSLAALLCNAPAAACNGSIAPAGAGSFGLNQSLPNFTFALDVALAMRHFPWLHFHMQGEGEYEEGAAYSVHFTSLPWFAPRPQHEVDLAMIDPAMWPTRFIYQQVGEKGGNTLFELHALDDPTLTDAVVGLGPKWCAREVQAAYNDGTRINMNIMYGMIGSFMLPATLTADINEPHLALSANGTFTDYTFGHKAVPAPPPTPARQMK